ncbi:hypothetical protein HIM_03405 [Hirsutella minnesotensis 3608]|uniref:Uncharacterized protein n=1 Tax=Hirsutella minnesotensis 3608 TaxID=1043627 RepID=A0A0F8A6H4_9HYPO|nr:hypothetical protein HIM_03405 [Hirsutella minnesotensis 3608]
MENPPPQDDSSTDEAMNADGAEASQDGPKRKQSSMTSRAIALELYSMHRPMQEITDRTGLKHSAFYALVRKAKQRGFNRGDRVLDEYIIDAPRSGRPLSTEGKRARARARAAAAAEAAAVKANANTSSDAASAPAS